MKRTFLLVLLLSAPSMAGAAVLQGRVTDSSTAAPLPGAVVRIPASDLEVLAGADGTWILPDAPEGPVRLVATLRGYEPLVITVESPSYARDLALQPLVSGYDEVVVTASRYGADLHLSHSNLTSEELEARHVVEDIPRLLEDLPGVHASSDAGNGMGYTYLSMRGFDQSRVGVMVNGIPLNDPEDHQVYWVDLPDLAESLEDIQVQRGVSNGIGGPVAIGGTVNLLTSAHGVEPSGKSAFYAGSYNTSKQMVAWESGIQGGRLSTSFRMSHLQSDGFRDRSGTDQWAAFGSVRLLSPRATTTLNAYGGREVTHQAWYGVSADQLQDDPTYNPEVYSNAVDAFSQPHLELHHDWRLSQALTWTHSTYYIRGQGYYENAKEGETAEDFGLDLALGLDPAAEVDLVRRKYVRKDQAGLVSRLEWEHPRGRLVAGGDGYFFQSDHWGDVLSVSGVPLADTVDPTTYYRYDGRKLAGAAFLHERFQLGGGLTLLAELHGQLKTYDFLQAQVGHFTGDLRNGYTVGYAFFNPKGGLFWESPGEPGGGKLGLYVYSGLSHREPADADLFDTWYGPDDLGVTPLFATSEAVEEGGETGWIRWSDPLVDPERVLDTELGGSWRSSNLVLALNGYWMDFRNEIVSFGGLNDEGMAVRGNANRTVHAGVEGSLSTTLAERYQIRLAGSKSWDRYVDFTVYEDQWNWDTWEYLGTEAQDLAGNPIAGFPSFLASARVSADWKVVVPALRYRGVGRQYLDNTGDLERTVDPAHTLDASVAVRPQGRAFRGMVLDLRCNNVLDTRYALAGYYDAWGAGNTYFPAAGRNFMAGVRTSF